MKSTSAEEIGQGRLMELSRPIQVGGQAGRINHPLRLRALQPLPPRQRSLGHAWHMAGIVADAGDERPRNISRHRTEAGMDAQSSYFQGNVSHEGPLCCSWCWRR
jgi:hypothetical protein